MPLVLHSLPILSDDAAHASKETLPRYLRLKSQSLCKYLSVSKDEEGRLTFSENMDHSDTSLVFETLHVQALENLSPYGWKGVKIRSLSTKKYWRCVSNSKVPKYNLSQSHENGVGKGNFKVIMAIAESEDDADIFDIEVKEIGEESKKVILRNLINRRYLAPLKISQNTTDKCVDFLGCMCKEISWKESIFIVECVIGPRTIWPMGILSESALASFIQANQMEPSEDQTSEELLPPTVILPPSFLSQVRKRSLDNILIENTKPQEGISVAGPDNISLNDTQGDTKDPTDGTIGLSMISPALSLSDAPRKLKPEEMAILYCDSPDPGGEPDPPMANISCFESEFIYHMTLDWAKDWMYSLTGKNNNDDNNPLRTPISKSESDQKSHRSQELWERMKGLKTWAERKTLIDNYMNTGNNQRIQGRSN